MFSFFFISIHISFWLNIAEHHKGHHHDHMHDSAVSSVSIVSEGTLDIDEVINIISRAAVFALVLRFTFV